VIRRPLNAYLATVTRVLPDRHGVQVRFGDGVHTIDPGNTSMNFVRVLAKRAHPQAGAEVRYPRIGEQGIVLELPSMHQVWIGSLHWQDNNQIDPTDGIEIDKHDSGIIEQKRPNGDMQLDHPSGLRVTIAQASGPLSTLKRTGAAGPVPQKTPCFLEIEHPSGLKLAVDKDGGLTLSDAAGNPQLAISSDGKAVVQGGASKFLMEPFFQWAQNHTHGGVQAGSGATTAPLTPPPSTSLSPDALKGPHA
jgi:hypothetical protein